MSDGAMLSLMFAELGKELSARGTNVGTRVRQDVDVGFAVETTGVEQDCWGWRFSVDCVDGPKMVASASVQGMDRNFIDFVSVAAANGSEMASFPT